MTAKMKTKTIPYDSAEHFTTPDAQADLLTEAFESGDAAYIAHALGIIARAKGMTEMAKQAGITREGLYRSLSTEGDPRLSTLLGVARALGMRLSMHPKSITPDEAQAAGISPLSAKVIGDRA